MKPLKLILILLVLFFIIPLIIGKLAAREPADKQTATPTGDPDEILIVPVSEEVSISMYNTWTKKLEVMPLEEYLVGVVAGEMPSSFHIEALKAQAVAARTLAVQKMLSFGGAGCNLKQGADVCSSYAHCQEWISQEQMKKNWGDEYDVKLKRIQQAVNDTYGKIMTYNGKPIEVLYHSTSNGKTEDAGEVFSNSLPYYKVVESKGEEGTSKFDGSVTYSNQKFVEIFKKTYNKKLDPNRLKDQVKINGYTESGRVSTITVGGVKMRARDFRAMYGLNSTDFKLYFGKDSVTIKTKGFGHGVGMSQVGADKMGQDGYSYEEILQHYYVGVTIENY